MLMALCGSDGLGLGPPARWGLGLREPDGVPRGLPWALPWVLADGVPRRLEWLLLAASS